MIVEWFFQQALSMGQWFFSLFPDTSSAQNLVVTAENSLAPILAGAGAIGAWMPWNVLGIVFPIVMGVYVAAFAVKVVRQMASHIPQIGGTG